MQVQDEHQQSDQNHDGRNENEPHGGCRVDEYTDLPLLGIVGCPEYHQLGVWNDWTPDVTVVMGPCNSDLEILHIVVYFSKTKVDEGKAQSIGVAVVALLA